MRPSIFIGVDPGLSGAIAVWEPEKNRLDVYDMPAQVFSRGGKDRVRVDHRALGSLVRGLCADALRNSQLTLAAIEDVGGIPGQSADASCTFGKAIGAAEQAIAGAGIPLTYVPPGVWKRAAGLVGTNKSASRDKASKEFPSHAGKWPLVKHDGRAEAALLARYLERKQ